ncbi:ankyrin repeat protein [Histomonas meleagridis]|uniref:ankyrin repeat protein n=1 Tax=Histomonas meleagridis TaxID=135588 RepID=UPI00355A7F23|nr:ankyrin repeat protein [Histomonas meleagridis]KAH0799565.1 ankyrin repeat protein [Histomonas meleagridis]
MHNRRNIVTLLLHSGADTKLKNQLGKTPEDIAEADDRGDIAQLLQKKEASDESQNKTRSSLLYTNILHEQHQMNKTLEEMVGLQDKQSEIISQLKGKVMSQANALNIMQVQQQQMRRQLAEIDQIAQNISKRIDVLVPKNTSSSRFVFYRSKQ